MRSGFLGIRHPQHLQLEIVHHRHHLAVRTALSEGSSPTMYHQPGSETRSRSPRRRWTTPPASPRGRYTSHLRQRFGLVVRNFDLERCHLTSPFRAGFSLRSVPVSEPSRASARPHRRFRARQRGLPALPGKRLAGEYDPVSAGAECRRTSAAFDRRHDEASDVFLVELG
jgi:hypothetical protein